MVELYIGFCLTTSIVSLIKHFIPNLTKMLDEGIENEVSTNKTISCIVYFALCFIIAPMVFFATIIPSISDIFKEKMYESLIEKN